MGNPICAGTPQTGSSFSPSSSTAFLVVVLSRRDLSNFFNIDAILWHRLNLHLGSKHKEKLDTLKRPM
jgi:hypothetical protein